MFGQAFKNIDDALWKDAGCSSELDYTEQSSRLLFLNYLNDLERDRAVDAEHAICEIKKAALLVAAGRSVERGLRIFLLVTRSSRAGIE